MIITWGLVLSLQSAAQLAVTDSPQGFADMKKSPDAASSTIEKLANGQVVLCR